ncbi:hypothetical protein ACRQ1B_00725 [Rhizobium panacihumi]|uniref:hypothetical protein n=1 Tax=Rhizobium panacihumi TaxID=2008450 RepID=UPI003D7B39F3
MPDTMHAPCQIQFQPEKIDSAAHKVDQEPDIERDEKCTMRIFAAVLPEEQFATGNRWHIKQAL